MSAEEIAAGLYARVRGCQLCALAKTRTLAVPGEGPLTAEVMFIGEAPGANEDKLGRPFVGAAGNFLGELLAAAGLGREEVYICNVLKCRPPGNRDPLPAEIDACRDYLDEQIDLVDPLVIVTLGRFSMAKFFPNQVISRVHGQPRETAGRFYVPMYHPAAALHQGNLREVMLTDFRTLPALLARARGQAGLLQAGGAIANDTPSRAPAPAHGADSLNGEPASGVAPIAAGATLEQQRNDGAGAPPTIERTDAPAGALAPPAEQRQMKLFE